MAADTADLVFYGLTSWMVLIASLTALIYTSDMFGALFGANHFAVEGRHVLITGGSQGLGRALASHLAAKGASIIIVARNQAKLDAALTHIRAHARSPSQTFHALSADLTEPDAAEHILSEATRLTGAPPDIVWANAGSAHPGLLAEVPVSALRAQMDVNYFAALYLARASLRLWLADPRTSPAGKELTTEAKSEAAIYGAEEKRTRHFVVTSSTAAWVGVAGYTPYAPAKAALRSLHDNLRSEMALYNGAHARDPAQPTLSCAIVHPGTILTPGYEEENRIKHPVTKMLEADDPAQTEDETAAAAVRALERGRRIIATQGLQGSVMRGSSMMGSVRDRWIGDTFWAWLASLAWLFVAGDMEGKVFRWGRDKGVESTAS